MADTYTFNYTGNVQTWVAPYTGRFKFELWGARGGRIDTNESTGGLGGYVSGEIDVIKGQVFYIFVGGRGQDSYGYIDGSSSLVRPGGWNGGGQGTGTRGPSGGGGTDIRFGGTSINDRIIVAGGGGGGFGKNPGGATTNLTNTLFQGEHGISGFAGRWPRDEAGGGGGYYGGGTIHGDDPSQAYGGSSYAGSQFKNVVMTPGVRDGHGLVVITSLLSITISNLTYSSTTHKDNVPVSATIGTTGQNLDVQYRVLVNNKVNLDWSQTKTTPYDISFEIDNSALNIGNNTVSIEMKSPTNNLTLTQNITITKTNALPTVSGSIKGQTLTITVNDPDGDLVQHRVFLNGEQLFPGYGFTGLRPVPYTFQTNFPNPKIKVKQQNTVKIEARDDMGQSYNWTLDFIGDYSGLMFCDQNENYYSTNIGEVLKYLDFGVIQAGQTTVAEKVWVKNTLAFPVKNIRLWVDHRDLDPNETTVYISKLNAPFEPSTELFYDEVLQPNEKISFYVSISTKVTAMHGGMFDIKIKADPA